MSILIRFGRLLVLALWIGGIAFFAFAVAPVAFGRLASAHDAGLVVGGTLRVLHGLGLVCGVVFLVLTAGGERQSLSRRLFAAECVLSVSMLALTAASQFGVLPAMEAYRTEAGGDVNAAPSTDAARLHFERLHAVSERMEGGVLLGGLALLFAVASETAALRR
ncbi:MAG: hypothetical protein NVSMB3_08330 [Acidobacteriaceae bacterium]